MRRANVLIVAVTLTVGLSATPSTAATAMDGPVLSRSETNGCSGGGVRLQTVPESRAEAEYNDDLIVCDRGPQTSGMSRYSFSNRSPVVWAFYDSEWTRLVPRSPNAIRYSTYGTVPLFRQFALATGISPTAWIVAPGETVYLDAIEYVSFTIAANRILSSWLLYKQQAAKISALGKQYLKQIATANSTSKARTFLWTCVATGVTTNNALNTDVRRDAIVFAGAWLNAAKAGSECRDSFTDLFGTKPKSSTLPESTSSIGKWFTTKRLTQSNAFVADIAASREVMATVTGLFRIVRT